jgi:hypothetical protein
VFRENTTRGTDKARIDIVMVKNLAGSLQDGDDILSWLHCATISIDAALANVLRVYLLGFLVT